MDSTAEQDAAVGIPVFSRAPERDPDRYGATANYSQKRCAQLAANFFHDGVRRARESNQRQSELDRRLAQARSSGKRRQQMWLAAGRREAQYLRFLRTADRPDNYRAVKIIGRGAFGEVKLVQRRAGAGGAGGAGADAGRAYALKSLVKTEMLRREQVAHIRAERDILAEAESPWVVRLFATFQDAHFLYLLMEYLPGGDLMTMLIKYEVFSEDITRFYMAECVLAIEAVHGYGFIHRDIKPDNILLDRGGHIKLTDFGLSTGFHRLHDNAYYQQLLQPRPKPGESNSGSSNNTNGGGDGGLGAITLTVSNRAQINERRRSRRAVAYSAVGTQDYIAIEVLAGGGHSFGCDWWSLGAIMYECLVGWAPFCADDRRETYRRIVNWRQALQFPPEARLAPEAEGLIRSLVCDADDRLGRAGGAPELRAHAFFRGVRFDDLRRIRAPFEPHLASDLDTSCFPVDDIDQTDSATLLRRARAAQQQAAAAGKGPPPPAEPLDLSLPFIGYTFKRFDSSFR